ncbi:MAG TPA: hypothetical protein VGN23_00655 [Verrucomicrobiae bacterium]
MKGGFQDIINAVADGKGMKRMKRAASNDNVVRASEPAKPKKP